MDKKYVSRLEAAARSGLNVFIYAASTTFSGMIAAQVFAPNQSQVPDIERLKGWGVAAGWSGVVALVAFIKNYVKPKDYIPASYS